MEDIVTGQEQTLDIPAHLLKRKYGFSLDVGGSVTKIVYSLPFEDKVRMHFICYPRERMEEALQYLKVKIAGKMEAGSTMYTCGIGCNIYLQQLEEVHKVKIHNLMETDCIVDGFQFLVKNFPLEEVVFPESETVTEYSDMMRDFISKMQHSLATAHKEDCRGKMWKSSEVYMAKLQQEQSDHKCATQVPSSSTSEQSVQKVEYPTLLCIMGSATSPLQIEESGDYLCLDIISTGGKSLMALGSLLAGAKTFEELMALAEKGSSEKMDILGKHLPLDDDVYALLKTDFTAFALGHAVGKNIDDFSKEDLAAGVCSFLAQNLAQVLINWVLITKKKQTFFVGGLANHHYMRDQLGKYFAYRSKSNAVGFETQHHFVKLGSYLGALGGLLTSLNA